MLIELRGVEFVNKGAELMLHAIMKEVREHVPGVTFVMEEGPRTPKGKLAEFGILRKTKFRKFGINFSPMINSLPWSLRKPYGLVADHEINAVLDGSGFAFGDKWGAKKAGERSADHIEKWKKENKKVVLLPQAFGAFTDDELISKMRTILNNADLIFARDSQSFKYLSEISTSAYLRQSPDFTNLIAGIQPDNHVELETRIAIIPNQKMMETENAKQNDDYPFYLAAIISLLQKKGEDPFFLIHESKKDGQIADLVNSKLETKIDIIKEENPLRVKGIIGASKATITSRFHGLVSALSQGIPSLSTGWSHKYQELLNDYEYPEALCEVSLDQEYLSTKLSLLLDLDKRNHAIDKLKANATLQKEKSNKMWSKVAQVLTGK